MAESTRGLQGLLDHTDRAPHSDWFVNSFIIDEDWIFFCCALDKKANFKKKMYWQPLQNLNITKILLGVVMNNAARYFKKQMPKITLNFKIFFELLIIIILEELPQKLYISDDTDETKFTFLYCGRFVIKMWETYCVIWEHVNPLHGLFTSVIYCAIAIVIL